MPHYIDSCDLIITGVMYLLHAGSKPRQEPIMGGDNWDKYVASLKTNANNKLLSR